MDFYINKDSTLPALKMELVQYKETNHELFYEKLQNSNIYFTMSDIETGIKKIGRKHAFPELKDDKNPDSEEEYLITYQFDKKDTSKPGTFIGQFIIEFLDGSGTLVAPIREQLRIHVLEGHIKK